MTVHGSIEFRAVRTGLQVKFSIEREDFEKIAMRSGRRTGPSVIALTKIARALDRASGRTVLGHLCRFRIDVPDDPMREQTARCIGIIDNQDQRFRFVWDAANLQFRTYVPSVTCKFGRNIGSGLKGRASDRDRSSSIHIKSHSKENREGKPYRFHSCNFGRARMPSSKQTQASPRRHHRRDSPRRVRTRRNASLRGHPFDKLEACRPKSGRKANFRQRSHWKTNGEQRNVASPWQTKRKQRITICARRFCDSFRSRSIGHWIKSKSPLRLVTAQRDGTKCAALSMISNRKAKSRAFEKIGTSCPTQPISSPER